MEVMGVLLILGVRNCFNVWRRRETNGRSRSGCFKLRKGTKRWTDFGV